MGIISSFLKKREVPPDITSNIDEHASAVGQASDPYAGSSPGSSDDDASEKTPKAGTASAASSKAISAGKLFSQFTSSVERLQVQMEALNVSRGASNERFTRISEQIGELRSMIIEAEKKIKNVDVTATKAADLVSTVQPEALAKDVRKIDSKTEQLKAKLEANEAVSADIIAELKRIRNQMILFKGTEGVLKLNEEVKLELISIQKLKAITESHSDKVEKIFMDMQKNYVEFEHIKNKQQDLDNAVNEISKAVGGLTIRQQQAADKKDIIAIDQSIESKSHIMEKQIEKINKFERSLDSMAEVNDKLAELCSYNKQQTSQVQKELEEARSSINSIVEYFKKLTKTTNQKASKDSVDEMKTEIKAELQAVKESQAEAGSSIDGMLHLIGLLKNRLDRQSSSLMHENIGIRENKAIRESKGIRAAYEKEEHRKKKIENLKKKAEHALKKAESAQQLVAIAKKNRNKKIIIEADIAAKKAKKNAEMLLSKVEKAEKKYN